MKIFFKTLFEAVMVLFSCISVLTYIAVYSPLDATVDQIHAMSLALYILVYLFVATYEAVKWCYSYLTNKEPEQ